MGFLSKGSPEAITAEEENRRLLAGAGPLSPAAMEFHVKRMMAEEKARTDEPYDRVTWTPYNLTNADDTLAHALRNFILGNLFPDDFAKNWVKSAQTLICQVLNKTAFPLIVNIDDDLYIIANRWSEVNDRLGIEEATLSTPMKIACTYCAGKDDRNDTH